MENTITQNSILNDKILVSVIVPIYNQEKYLAICLDSLINQTYTNIEIICINDGSTDGSGEILKQYSKRNSKIKIISKTNAGLSQARKDGINHSTGEYIMIVDSDDWLEKNAIQIALNSAIQDKSDIVIFDYIKEYSHKSESTYLFENDKIFNRGDRYLTKYLLGPSESLLNHPEKLDALNPVCFKLYKRDTLNNVKYIDVKEAASAEDLLFNLSVFNNNLQVSYIHYAGYHYRRCDDSSITKKYRPNLKQQRLLIFDHLLEYAENEADVKAIYNRFAFYIISLGLNELENPEGLLSQISEIRKLLKLKYYFKGLQQLNLNLIKPLHWKLFFYFAKHNNSISVWILLKLMKFIINRNN